MLGAIFAVLFTIDCEGEPGWLRDVIALIVSLCNNWSGFWVAAADMGVHGLWKLLESTGKPINPETLEGKILAVGILITTTTHRLHVFSLSPCKTLFAFRCLNEAECLVVALTLTRKSKTSAYGWTRPWKVWETGVATASRMPTSSLSSTAFVSFSSSASSRCLCLMEKRRCWRGRL